MGPHGEREKISDPGEIRPHYLRNRSPLLYQLSYKARWELYILYIALSTMLNSNKESSWNCQNKKQRVHFQYYI